MKSQKSKALPPVGGIVRISSVESQVLAGDGIWPQFRIQAFENHVYVVWTDERTKASDIYFCRSEDGGKSWKAEIRLDADKPEETTSDYPVLWAGRDGHVYAAWRRRRGSRMAGSKEIVFRRSTDYGRTWDEPKILNRGGGAFSPRMVSDGQGRIYVVWPDERDGKMQIYFNRSLDGGGTWLEEDKRISYGDPRAFHANSPDIACDSSGNICVAWWAEKTEELPHRIVSNASYDFGQTWQRDEIWVNRDKPVMAHPPKLVRQNGGIFHVLWYLQTRERTGTLYLNTSYDKGKTWGASSAAYDCSWCSPLFPQLAADSQAVYVVWETILLGSEKSGKRVVHFNASYDGGKSWLYPFKSPHVISHGSPINEVFLMAPQMAVNDQGYVAVVWSDNRTGRNRAYMNYSRDRGRTWQREDMILDLHALGRGKRAKGAEPEAETIEAFYPQVFLSDNNDLLVVWCGKGDNLSSLYFRKVSLSAER